LPDAALSNPSGALLVALLLVATVAVLVQATLIHLAAKLVIEAPRFGSAFLSLFILWCVAIPLRVLHVWTPAALGVWLLTTFGSLKIAYSASTPRTLFLFVASVAAAIGVGLGLKMAMAHLAK
jgi:hypothetical protein